MEVLSLVGAFTLPLHMLSNVVTLLLRCLSSSPVGAVLSLVGEYLARSLRVLRAEVGVSKVYAV